MHVRFAVLIGLVVGCCFNNACKSLASAEFAIEPDTAAIARKAEILDSLAATPAPRARFNVVVLLADDLAKYDVACYGGGAVPTPNLDALAQQGVQYNAAYITSPVCSPSRAGMLTGRYQQRFGFEFQMHDRYLKNAFQYYGFQMIRSDPWHPIKVKKVPDNRAIFHQGLPLQEITLAELLKTQGYTTACLGKWHLGTFEGALPCARGFDEHYGFYASHSLYAPEDNPDVVDHRLKKRRDWSDQFMWESQREGNCALYSNCCLTQDSTYLTDLLAQKAVRFLEAHQAEPFFLYVPFSAVHTPLQAPIELVAEFDTVKDPAQRIYYAMIKSLDLAVGRIVGALDSLNLAENTLLVFLSDNGGATYTTVADNSPLKGGKITHFEGGVNVPLLARWPGKLPAGETVDVPVSSLDLFATVAEALDINFPADRPLDGRSLVSLAQDFPAQNTPASEARPLFWRAGYMKSVRLGDWKLVWDTKTARTRLYALTENNFELTDVSPKHPEVVNRLKSLIEAWEATLREPLWPANVVYRYRETRGGGKQERFNFPN